MEHDKILELIESLSPYSEEEILRDHVAVLDEVCFKFHAVRLGLKGHNKPREFIKGGQGYLLVNRHDKVVADIPKKQWDVVRSLDVCQAAMLEGWAYRFENHNIWRTKIFLMVSPCGKFSTKHVDMPTLPLAWTHAITQVYKWEAENETR